MEKEINYPFLRFLKDISIFVRPYQKKFWLGFILRFSSDIAHLYPPFAISQLVLVLSKNLPPEQALPQIITILTIWGIASVYVGIGQDGGKYFGFQVAEQAGLDIYKKTLKHILRLDLAWQEIENSGNKMKRIERGRDGVNEIIRRVFEVLISVLVNTVGVLFIFFTLEKALGLAIVFFIISYFTIGTILLKRAVKQEQIVNERFEDLGGITFESLNNIQTIKSLSISNKINKTVSDKSNILIEEIKKRIFLFRRQGGFLESYFHFFEFLMASLIVWGVFQGRYEISFLILFLGLFNRVGESTDELISVGQQIVIAKIWVSRAMQILQIKPVIENEEKQTSQILYPKNWKTLKIKNLSFNYKKKKVLDNISLNIKRGESIGIVGLSGAGKSTLFKLLLDLYEDYLGEILLDDKVLKNIKRESYIQNISVVLQDTELFNMSLRENITIAQATSDAAGVEEKPQDKLTEVIRMSHLTDVVADLPEGIETLVGEKGIKLSGGQRQRLGIARALFREPDILFLDEATSHLDAYSEKQIQIAIHENIHKFTTIVIAHRLSTIKEMDKIVVLEGGKVKELGTFDELLKKNGSFARMWHEQKL